jgi:hypothetical protein
MAVRGIKIMFFKRLAHYSVLQKSAATFRVIAKELMVSPDTM